MDDTSSLGSLGTLSDRPLTDLVRTACEEAAEIQALAHCDDSFGKGGLRIELLAFLCSGLLGLEGRQVFFERRGEGDDRVAG